MKEKSKVKEIDRQIAIKGHTIASLAKETGLTKLTVREVLCCERFPSAKTSKLLAKAIGMNVEDFRAMIYDAQPEQPEQQSA